MDRPTDGLEAEFAFHREREFANQLARVRGNHRRADNVIRAFANMDTYEAFCFAIENRAVHFTQLLRERVHFDAYLSGLLLVKTDVGDFR
jgi:hypothetical protein